MAFDVSLLPWQEEVWDDPARFKVVAAGRRTGKSRLAAYMLLVKGLQTTDGEIFYVAPTQGQARDILWNLLLERDCVQPYQQYADQTGQRNPDISEGK